MRRKTPGGRTLSELGLARPPPYPRRGPPGCGKIGGHGRCKREIPEPAAHWSLVLSSGICRKCCLTRADQCKDRGGSASLVWVPPDDVECVRWAILATTLPQWPRNRLDEILVEAVRELPRAHICCAIHGTVKPRLLKTEISEISRRTAWANE